MKDLEHPFCNLGSVLIEQTASTDLEPAPIFPDWILKGTPQARSKVLVRTHDRTCFISVWECSAGIFNWQYGEDETVVIISGEAFIGVHEGKERRLGPGDLGFFPAGTSCIWRIDNHVKKVAVVRKDLPPMVGVGVRAWHKFLRRVGLRRQAPLVAARQ
jgi:uncharacterized cupin superfamily protein